MPISKTMKQVTATKESEEKNDETAITGAAAKEETANVEMVETTRKEETAEKKAPVKKAATRKTTKTTVKKTTSKKTPEQKTSAKEEIHIQFIQEMNTVQIKGGGQKSNPLLPAVCFQFQKIFLGQRQLLKHFQLAFLCSCSLFLIFRFF